MAKIRSYTEGMSDYPRQILERAEDPRELEALYREDARAFGEALPEALRTRPESLVLQAWEARLAPALPGGDAVPGGDTGAPPSHPEEARGRWIWLTVVLSLGAGTLVKLPEWFDWDLNEMLFFRNVPLIIMGAIGLFFCLRISERRRWIGFLILGGVLPILGNLYPADGNSNTAVLTSIHLAFVGWSVLAVLFMGERSRSAQGRLDYLEWNGELTVYTGIILCGGVVLTAITFGLFTFLDVDIFEWYFENVVVYGLVASPIVATLLVEEFTGKKFRLGPLISRVFTPLFVATVVFYLVTAFATEKTPYQERESLIAINILLIVVLALCILNTADRKPDAPPRFYDYLNFILLALTLVADIIALSAIVYRFSEYGLSPNRLTVLVANLLIFIHLLGILLSFLGFLRQKRSFETVRRWITFYLPVYFIWAVIVAFLFPFLFAFR